LSPGVLVSIEPDAGAHADWSTVVGLVAGGVVVDGRRRRDAPHLPRGL
jgi:hypothetical protein